MWGRVKIKEEEVQKLPKTYVKRVYQDTPVTSTDELKDYLDQNKGMWAPYETYIGFQPSVKKLFQVIEEAGFKIVPTEELQKCRDHTA